MNRIFTAAIAVAALALAGTTFARATTFPTLTPIYFASGAMNVGPAPDIEVSTVVNCSNMSGQTASIRFQFRGKDGTPHAGATLLTANLASQNVASGNGVGFTGGPTVLPTGLFYGGSIQILSTQSAVFCTAWLAHPAGSVAGPASVALHMVRFNPHPGTVE